jgi:hypothetical protein
MPILVEVDAKAGQRSGDWIVRNGAGGQILSRHRTKRKAKSKARSEARKRNTNMRVQSSSTGQWSQGPSY